MKVLTVLIQCTWGIIQTFVGFIVFLLNIKNKHYIYHGAIVTELDSKDSVSLGLFIFIASPSYIEESIRTKKYLLFYLKDNVEFKDILNGTLVHEYGHYIQSLILGPLYLFVIGIPSTIWNFNPKYRKLRVENHISYFSIFCEKWANKLGEKVIGEKTLEHYVTF